jgi:hypothetical protein
MTHLGSNADGFLFVIQDGRVKKQIYAWLNEAALFLFQAFLESDFQALCWSNPG